MGAAAVVRRILEQSGMTKSRLAAEAGVSRAQLDRYLSGRTQPGYEQLARLADAAGFDLEVDLRPQPRPFPEDLLLVLEFGETFETKPPKPLINLGPVWREAARRREAIAAHG
ncbi:helix-turn-helix domain-containing protein [Nocardioides ginsengisoli]|uniref:Helix-turn-helix domain-containing protein n=1 Tax=Nocardioides ginsengisoli TaxID=363868 RepID=A0ABW3W258_9ACTN